MTQGPWSVKGIDPKARSAARERALQKGLTLGQYLNTLLLDETPDDDEADASSARLPERAETSDLIRMAREIDELSGRLETAQARSARMIAGVDKSIVGLMGKVEATSRSQTEGVEKVSQTLGDIQSAQAALRERLDGLEARGGTEQTVTAVRALESSLARLSQALSDRTEALDRSQSDLRQALETKVAGLAGQVADVARSIDTHVGSAIRTSAAGLVDRVDRVEAQLSAAERRMDGALGRISDAATRYESFETKTERTLGDNAWRMERALESALARSRAMSKDLLERVDTIEEKTQEAVGALGEALSRVGERLNRAERRSEAAAGLLEKSVTAIDERLRELSEKGGGGVDVDRLQGQLQKRFDALAEDISRPIVAARADLERRLEDALRTQQPDRLDRLENNLRQMQDRLAEAEARQSGAVEAMSAQVERMMHAFEERLSDPEVLALGDIRSEMTRLADSIEARLAGVETADRLKTVAFEGIRADVTRMEAGFEERIALSERRNVSALGEVGEQVAQVAERMQRRHEESIQRLSSRIEEARSGAEDDGPDISALAERFDERIRESERRSASAIAQIGEQVARVADRLQTQHKDSMRALEGLLTESGKAHQSRLADALSDMTRRLEDIGEQTAGAMAPVHSTMSSIARRVARLEDREAGESDKRSGRPFPPGSFEPSATGLYDEDVSEPDPSDDFIADLVAGITAEIDRPPARPADAPKPARSFADIQAERAATQKNAEEPSRPIEDLLPFQELDDLIDVDEEFLDPDRQGGVRFAPLPLVDPSPPEADIASERLGRTRSSSAAVSAPTKAPPQRRTPVSVPLAASAAIALAVAGGTAWTLLRGKQEPASGDAVPRSDPAAPSSEAPAPASSDDLLFSGGPPVADEAGATPPTIAGERATAAELFDETESTGGQKRLSAPAGAPKGPTLVAAVEAGDPIALYDTALDLLKTADKARGARMMKESASKGLVMAQYQMARLFEKGEGVPRDLAASRSWTEQAAIGGNVKAMHDLAVFFAEGEAGPQSYSSAAEWFRQAADVGVVDSQYNLALLFEQGQGVARDPAEAAFWYGVAGRAGDADGARKSETILGGVPRDQADKIRTLIRSFTPKQPIARANGEFGARPWDKPGADQISEAQRLLIRLGYLSGQADGQMNARTAEAIRAFEASKGLPATGSVSANLVRQLLAATLNGGG
jgi:localization factor PodJL